jgi:quercetin dioxygenase-like cupin family protein
MLELSDIQSPPEELDAYYAQLRAQHITPAWIGGGISIEPQSKAVPYLWHWRDLRPQAMRAAELVGTRQAERRVLRLTNPELSGVASKTLVANIQIVMPGEIARAHRHSGKALRLIIEGSGGYTVVNGERVPMSPGDLVLTPNWSWHDHANDSDAPMNWLDGLDTPLVRMLEAGFYEEYNPERQEIAAPVNASEWRYPMTEMQAALHRLAAAGTADEVVLEYKNRRTGYDDDRLSYAAAAPRREDAGAPPSLLHQFSCGRRGRPFGRRRQAARLGRQGRVHGADLDVLRARQQRRPVGVFVQLQRRAGDASAEPLPGGDQAVRGAMRLSASPSRRRPAASGQS